MGKIMLIDDDYDDRLLFKETLKSTDPGITCITCKSGVEALKQLSLEKSLPDVLFVDINMPEVSGWELAENLKKSEQLKEIPIIMYSTSAHQIDILKAGKIGATGYCTKPEEVRDLKELLEFICTNIHDLTKETISRSGLLCFKRVDGK